MKCQIILAIFAMVLSVGFGYTLEEDRKTSSIVINNGVKITGLDYRPEHPIHPFTNFERDAKCSGSCVCSGSSCDCSCSGCTFDQCLNGCLLACWVYLQI